MASYVTLKANRVTVPDPSTLLDNLRTIDASIGMSTEDGLTYRLKKETVWTQAQIAAAQSNLDTTTELTPQREAQNEIDRWPIAERALVLALIDQLNVIRSKLVPALTAITPAQALQAVRDKAGTL